MSDIKYGIYTGDILQQLKAYLLDKEIDGKKYTRIVVLVPTLEEAIAEIERLRTTMQKIAELPDVRTDEAATLAKHALGEQAKG